MEFSELCAARHTFFAWQRWPMQGLQAVKAKPLVESKS
jgi:hypothetical protein